jgi:hypothetical protein
MSQLLAHRVIFAAMQRFGRFRNERRLAVGELVNAESVRGSSSR